MNTSTCERKMTPDEIELMNAIRETNEKLQELNARRLKMTAEHEERKRKEKEKMQQYVNFEEKFIASIEKYNTLNAQLKACEAERIPIKERMAKIAEEYNQASEEYCDSCGKMCPHHGVKRPEEFWRTSGTYICDTCGRVSHECQITNGTTWRAFSRIPPRKPKDVSKTESS